MTEDEMVGWHHRLNGDEFEQTPGVGDGQGGLECCSSWGPKESDMTDRLSHLQHSNTDAGPRVWVPGKETVEHRT